MTVADITPGCSDGPCRASGFRPCDLRALAAVGRGIEVLTVVTMLTANNFWAMSGHDRIMALNASFEQLGLMAGFLLVSVMAMRTQRQQSPTAQLHSIEASHDW
jgi:hypothetical protein